MVECDEPNDGPDQGQRRPIYPPPTAPRPKQTKEEFDHSDRIKSIDVQLFEHIFEEIGEYRNNLKTM